MGAGGLALLATAIADLLSRRTVISDELPHLIVVAGWLVLLRLAAVEKRLPGRPTLTVVNAAIARWVTRADGEGFEPLRTGPVATDLPMPRAAGDAR